MPQRLQGRIVVSPNAPVDILAMLPIDLSQGSARRDEASPSASPATSPRQRPRTQAAPREAWGADGGRNPSNPSRPGTARKQAAATQQVPQMPQMSEEWQNQTLFGGERYANPRAKRGFATTFRRPSSSRATPHSRPIFVVGPDAADPRICVDINAPQRFSSFERTRYELAWRKATPPTGVPKSEPPAATMSNIGSLGRQGRPSAGRPPMMDSRRSSCTQSRPDSVASARPYPGPSPVPGQRPSSQGLAARPMSTTPVQRGWAPSPTAALASWSGA